MLTTEFDITRIAVTNPVVADATVVQPREILIDGKEADTLAGHVDLRHPLAKSLEWVAHDTQ